MCLHCAPMIGSLIEKAFSALRLNLGLGELSVRVSRLQDAIVQLAARPAPDVPTVVGVLVEGWQEKTRRMVGNSVTLTRDEPQGLVELRTDVPLRKLQVIVFADISRVRVTGIFLGTDHIPAALGDFAPVVRASEWYPGMFLRVACERRDRA